jgi:serine/threonine-protein kinase HipA
MIEPVKRLEVYYDKSRVGHLALAPDRICAFEYDSSWLKNGFSISPFHLPFKAGVVTARRDPFDGLFGVFNDSLPDGWGRLLIDRWLAGRGIKPAGLSVLDRLCLVGSGGMGALTYVPDHSPESGETRHPLDFYAAEVEKILREDYSGSLDELVKNAGSSGGARPKVLVNIEGEEWLVKFRASVDPADVGSIEYEYSLLAKKCGLEMPETRLFEGKYFGVRRFDREGESRYHVHSASGLLYASHRFPSLDYTDLMKATLALTRDINEVEKMFRQMVFNVMIGNKDDHAKNFSFMYKGGKWILSPAYDLLPSAGFNGQHTTTVNGTGNPSINDCLEAARLTAFPETRARVIVQELEEVLRK